VGLSVKGTEMLGSTLGVAISCGRFSDRWTASPIFRDGLKVGGLRAIDAAGTSQQKASGRNGDSKIEEIVCAVKDLMETLEGRESGPDSGICCSMKDVRKRLIPRQRITSLDITLNEGDLIRGNQVWVGRLEAIGMTTEHA
jgi:hypothetical protein